MINNTQIGNAKDIDIVMSMYSLIEYSDNYSKTSGSFYKYHRDELALNAAGAIIDFPDANNNSDSFNFKQKIIDQTNKNDGTKVVDISTIKMSEEFSNPIYSQGPKFAITDIKLYIPVVILSFQNNTKLLQQLESGFKREINWNKYQSKVSIETRNQYLNFQADPNFQRVNRLFVLSFENERYQRSYFSFDLRRFLLPVEIKDCNVMNNVIFFYQTVKND